MYIYISLINLAIQKTIPSLILFRHRSCPSYEPMLTWWNSPFWAIGHRRVNPAACALIATLHPWQNAADD